MITFGYKSKISGPVRALVAIAVGIMMILAKDQAMNMVVKIIAAFILASGVVSLMVGLKNKANGTFSLMAFNAVVDIVIAVFLFVFDSFVANLIIYLIGIVLLIFGAIQLVSLFSANKVVKLGTWAFIMPSLVTLIGLFLLFNPVFIKSSISIIAGIALIIYGISELGSSWRMKKVMDEYEIKKAEQTVDETDDQGVSQDDIKDVDYEKVDEQ